MVVCWLWTGLLVLLYCFGGGTSQRVETRNEELGMVACLIMVPWIVGWVLPFVWRFIVYGSPRRRYYY